MSSNVREGRVVPFDRLAEQTRSSPVEGGPLHPAPESVTALGQTVTITGEIRADEHVIINGHLTGTVHLPEHGVAVGTHGTVDGSIFARAVTVLGTVVGTVTAEVRAELRETARMKGRLVAPRIAMEDGASFNGVIDTSRAHIATRVARYRAEQKSGA